MIHVFQDELFCFEMFNLIKLYDFIFFEAFHRKKLSFLMKKIRLPVSISSTKNTLPNPP